MELTEFLLARIDEDEAVAQEAMMRRDRSEPRDDEPWRLWWQDVPSRLCVDPARVLAECEAKRRIVAHIGEHERPAWTRGGKLRALRGGHEVLRALALPYRDHPDYDPAWAD